MLINQRILYRLPGSHGLHEGLVHEFAGLDNKFVCLSGGWVERSQVTVLLVLPDWEGPFARLEKCKAEEIPVPEPPRKPAVPPVVPVVRQESTTPPPASVAPPTTPVVDPTVDSKPAE